MGVQKAKRKTCVSGGLFQSRLVIEIGHILESQENEVFRKIQERFLLGNSEEFASRFFSLAPRALSLMPFLLFYSARPQFVSLAGRLKN